MTSNFQGSNPVTGGETMDNNNLQNPKSAPNFIMPGTTGFPDNQVSVAYTFAATSVGDTSQIGIQLVQQVKEDRESLSIGQNIGQTSFHKFSPYLQGHDVPLKVDGKGAFEHVDQPKLIVTDFKGVPQLSMIQLPVVSQPSPASSSQSGIQGLPFQTVGNSGDAMLSAINCGENDMLHDSAFDVGVSGPLGTLEEGLLGNMGAAPNIRMLENTSSSFDLFDGDGNINNSYKMDPLSPQTFHDTGAGFSVTDNTSMTSVPETDSSSNADSRRDSVESPVPGATKQRGKGRPTKPQGAVSKQGVQCPVCGKSFNNSSALGKHKLTHSDERKYICNVCSKAFKRQDHLNGHMMTHREKKPYECPSEGCEKSYCDHRSLRRHLENHHQQSAELSSTTAGSVAAATSSASQISPVQYSPATIDSAANILSQAVEYQSTGIENVDHLTGTVNFHPSNIDNSSLYQENSNNASGQIHFSPAVQNSPGPLHTAPSLVIGGGGHYSGNTTPTASPGYNNGVNNPTPHFQFDLQQQQPTVPVSSVPQSPHQPLSMNFPESNHSPGWQQREPSSGRMYTVNHFGNQPSPRSGEQSPGYLQQISPVSPAPGAVQPTSPMHPPQQRPPWFSSPPQTAEPGNLKQLDEPKRAQCTICNRRFKNMPALNGHMRLHGGYFKKEQTAKDEAKKSGKKLPESHLSEATLASLKEAFRGAESATPTTFTEPLEPESEADAQQQQILMEIQRLQEQQLQDELQKEQQQQIEQEQLQQQQNLQLAFHDHLQQLQQQHEFELQQQQLQQQQQQLQQQLEQHRLEQQIIQDQSQAATIMSPLGSPTNTTLPLDELAQQASQMQPVALMQEGFIQQALSSPIVQTAQPTFASGQPETLSVGQIILSQAGNHPDINVTQLLNQVVGVLPVQAPFILDPVNISLQLQQQQSSLPAANVDSVQSQLLSFSTRQMETSSENIIPTVTMSLASPVNKRPEVSDKDETFASQLSPRSNQQNPFSFNIAQIFNTAGAKDSTKPIDSMTVRNDLKRRLSGEKRFNGPIPKRSATVPTNLAALLSKAPLIPASNNKQAGGPTANNFETKSSRSSDDHQFQRSISEDFTAMRTKSKTMESFHPRSRTDDHLNLGGRIRNHHEDVKSRSDGAGFFRDPNLTASPFRLKKKPRPAPLFIPTNLNHTGFQSRLRSPRLWEGGEGRGNTPPPYTPPPMLSPVRSGSGLFWSLHGPFRSIDGKVEPHTPRMSLSRRSSLSNSIFPVSKLEEKIEPVPEEEKAPETDIQPHVNVGPQFQAELPNFCANWHQALKAENKESLMWHPLNMGDNSDSEVQCYQELACSSLVCGNGANVEYALHLLHLARGSIQDAVLFLMDSSPKLLDSNKLLTYEYQETDNWGLEEIEAYHQALMKCDKDFFSIAKEIKTKSVKQCVQFYYLWKKVCPEEYKRMRIIRRRREQTELYNLRSTRQQDESDSESSTTEKSEEVQNILSIKLEDLERPSSTTSMSPAPTYVCDFRECTATFNTKQALNGHARIHGGGNIVRVKPEQPKPTNNKVVRTTPAVPQKTVNAFGQIEEFPCKLCGKVFYKVKSRSAHMKSHSMIVAGKKAAKTNAKLNHQVNPGGVLKPDFIVSNLGLMGSIQKPALVISDI